MDENSNDNSEETTNENNEENKEICDPTKKWTVQKEIIKYCTIESEEEEFLLEEEEGYDSIYFPLSTELLIKPHSAYRVKVTVKFKNEENVEVTNEEKFKGQVKTSYSQYIAQKIINYENKESPFYCRYPDLNGQNNFPSKYNPTKTNFEIRLSSSDDLYVSSYEAMAYRKDQININNSSLTYNGLYDSCDKNEQCIDYFGCFNPEKKCKECKDYKCIDCDEKGCLRCPPNAIDEHWKNNDGNYINECHFAFIDLSNFYFVGKEYDTDAFVIENVPPVIHFRFTFDFWFYFDDYSILNDEVHVEVIYKDFMTIALTKENNNLFAYCIPLEWIYEFSFDYNIDFYKEKLIDYIEKIGAPYSKYNLGTEDKNWVYVKCGYNIDNNKMYINDNPESFFPIKQIYVSGLDLKQQNALFEMKKFYGPNNKTSIRFQGFNYLNPIGPAYTFIRNVNIFREYMPQNIDLRYFNLYQFDFDEFPQLLFSVPFDDVYYNKNITSLRNGTRVYIKKIKKENGKMEFKKIDEIKPVKNKNFEEFIYYVYDFSDKNSEIKQEKNLHLMLDKTTNVTTNKISKRIFFQPKKYFQRLNLLHKNTQFKDCDSSNPISILCNPGEFCLSDYKAYICNDSSYFYLDINKLECNEYCDNGYMRPPRYNLYDKRQYCSAKCPEHNNCPSHNLFYTSPITYFKCYSGFFNMYYKCYGENDVINDRGKTAIHFGNKTNSHNIYIPLKNENEEPYDSYVIDVWIYPDLRFREFGYEDDIKKKTSKDMMRYFNTTIFMTNSLKFILGGASEEKEDNEYPFKSILNMKNDGSIQKLSTSDKFNLNNWNHLIFSIDHLIDNQYEYFASYNHQQYLYQMKRVILTQPIYLKSIIFCNKDQYMIDEIKDLCSEIEWLDGYYRNIKIIDITGSSRYAAFYSYQFEENLVSFVKHHYIYNLESISNNILKDEYGGKDGFVIFPNNTDNSINPDNTNLINYEINFTPQDAFNQYQKSFVPKYSLNNDSKFVNVSFIEFKQCEIAVDKDRCLKCISTRGMQSNHCYGDENQTETESDIYNIFKNPAENAPEILSFDINAQKLKSERAITVFFFIKLYGFVEEVKKTDKKEIKIIILDSESNLYLAYNTDREHQSLDFKLNERVIFRYDQFRESFFGLWIPISITVFREYNRTFTMNMVSASMQYKTLGFNMGGGNVELLTEFPKINITEFSITNKWIGLLSDVKIFNTFILNAWGIVKFHSEDEVAKKPFKQIDFKIKGSTTECVKQSDLSMDLGYTLKVKCVPDFNPHWVKCSSMTINGHYWDQGEIYGFCIDDCGSDLHPRKCLGNTCYLGNCTSRSYINGAFEYKTDLFKNFYCTIKSEKDNDKNTLYRLQSTPLYHFDWNRFSHAEGTNILSPIDTYSIDFWFYTQNFRNVRYPKDKFNSGENKYTNSNQKYKTYTHNFDNIVIIWDYHTYVKVYYNRTNGYYYAQCIPLYVINHPEYTSTFVNEINLTVSHHSWIHITCGAHLSENATYLSKDDNINQQFFIPPITIPTNKNVTLVIDENSPRGYGVTAIGDLRLWKCYSCAQSKKYFDYRKSDISFANALHSFDNRRYTGTTYTRNDSFSDQAGNAKGYIKFQETDYPGVNILDSVGGYPQCNEYHYNYLYGSSCYTQFNVARLKEFEIKIPSSRNGRYSMAFWTYIDVSSELASGMNIIWGNHLSITLIKDKSNPNIILGICFPQAYKDKVDGLNGNDIYDLYDKTDNKERADYPDSSGIWIYVRCSVDHTRYLYNMYGTTGDKVLIGDSLYGNVKNHRPFRFFNWKTNYTIKFQNAYQNNARIFLRQVRLFKEFMDSRIDGMKYIEVASSENSHIYPVVFTMDFIENEYINSITYYLKYRINNEYFDFETNKIVYLYQRLHWKSDMFPGTQYKDYGTYPDLYVQKFCQAGQTSDGKMTCTGKSVKYGLDNNNHFFFPTSNRTYLNLDTLQVTADCETSCRNADSLPFNAYCLFKPTDNNNVDVCPTSYENAGTYDDYKQNFKCKDGYTKVYYECIKNDLVSKSAIYFSGFLSFPSLIFEDSSSSSNYYIEFWFKIDSLNLREENYDNQTYFFAYPHHIIKKIDNQKFQYIYYLEKNESSKENELVSISNYEWNKVVIENLYDKKKKKYKIGIYVNYKTSPDFSIELSNQYKMQFTGILFCNYDFEQNCTLAENNFTTLHWGMAWYKNIKVYSGEDVNIYLLNVLSDNRLTPNIHSLEYHWPFSADYINYNYVKERLNPTINDMKIFNWTFSYFDDEIRENYSIETYDYSLTHPGTFIIGPTTDNTNYSFDNCDSACKRCYSINNNDCYECKDGYILYNKICKEKTGYFFQTPLKDRSIEQVEIKKKVIDNQYNFDLENTNPITITIWIKFFGIDNDFLKSREKKEDLESGVESEEENEEIEDKEKENNFEEENEAIQKEKKVIVRDYNWPLFYLYNKDTYLTFNFKTKTLDFIIYNENSFTPIPKEKENDYEYEFENEYESEGENENDGEKENNDNENKNNNENENVGNQFENKEQKEEDEKKEDEQEIEDEKKEVEDVEAEKEVKEEEEEEEEELQNVPIIAYTMDMKQYYGVWVHFGISKYTSSPEIEKTFPHMFNLMFDKIIIPPLPIFNPSKVPVYINNFIFNTKPIVQYAYLRFYSNFWFGNYGHVTAEPITVQKQLLYSANLFLEYNSCIKNDILEVEIPDIKNKINCFSDYLPYELKCGDDNLYLDLNLVDNNFCDNCDNICQLNCFGNDKDKCTCDIISGLYWVGANQDYSKYKCQKIENINFALYNEFNFRELDIVENNEKAIYFWLIVYEYLKNNFDSIYIIWDKHMKITVEKKKSKKLSLKCYHDVDLTDDSVSSDYIETVISFGEWNYIRCQADINNNLFKLNGNEVTYTPAKYKYFYTSSLKIKDTSNVNYGFSFIRELKLYSSYNFDFWDDSRVILNKDSFPYLLHYFQFIKTNNNLSLEQTSDIIKENKYNIPPLKEGRIGYNYVINYNELVLCDIGFCYNEELNECEICIDPDCIIPKNKEKKCLKCPLNKKYLHDDDTCTNECGNRYGTVDYLLQCRRCHESCETCLNEDRKKCTSCHTIYHLVPDLNLCVENCEDYYLTNLVDVPNMCGPFNCHGNIIEPIILSDEYDYNINNDDYKEKIIDRDNFNTIKAEIVRSTSDIYEHLWEYNRLETIELNLEHRNYKDENDFPDESPFEDNADLSQLEVNIKKEYFKYGFKYVFYLNVYKYNEDRTKAVIVPLKFILIMGDYPLLDKIYSMPSTGFIGTNFLVTCKQCSDFKTDYNELEYKFTYLENSDYLNNIDDPNEILLQDWSLKSELIYGFDKMNPISKEDNKYYIKCYCRNEFNLFNSTSISIQVIDKNELNNQYTITDEIDDIFSFNTELSEEELSDRVQLLVSLYPVDVGYLDRTEVTNYDLNGVETQTLNLYEPIPVQNDYNCNKKGSSYLIYKFLHCICEDEYLGNLCQISSEVYNKLLPVYKKLYTKILNDQITYNEFLVKAINDLVKSSSGIFPFSERNYFIQIIKFIGTLIEKFPNDILKDNRYEIFFNIYYYLFEFGIRGVNQYKADHYYKKHKNEKVFDESTLRNYSMDGIHELNIKDYFNSLREGLNNLVTFYASNEIEIKYSNRDFNIYIAIVDQNFDFDNYFQNEFNKYEPYVNPSLCLNKLESQNPLKIYIGINYKISPYMSDYNVYWDNSSPIITIKFLDKDSKQKLIFSNCDSYLKFYFPISQYQIVNRVNENKNIISPENQLATFSNELFDPVFIDKNGNVYNTTLEERRKISFLPFNFSCREIVYKDSQNDRKKTINLVSLDFTEYTNDNYIICSSSNLVSETFNEFVVEYFDVNINLSSNSRFFFLKRIELFKNKNNYIKNPIPYYYSSLIIFGFLYLIIFSVLKLIFPIKYSVENNLRRSIISQNLPYENLNDYDLYENIKISPNDKHKLEKEKNLKKVPPLYSDIQINRIIPIQKESRNEKQSKYNKKFFKSGDSVNSNNESSNRKLNLNKERNIFYQDNNLENSDKKNSPFFQGNPPLKKHEKRNKNNFFIKGDTSIDNESNNENNNDDNIVIDESNDKNIYIHSGLKRPINEKLYFYNEEYKEDLNNFNMKKEEININKKYKVKIKNEQISEDIKKKELPDLNTDVTWNKLLMEFYNLEISQFDFFKNNFNKRYILYNLFSNYSLIYPKYKRIINFIAQCCLYTFFLSILFIFDKNMVIIPKVKGFSYALLFIVYCCAAEFFSCLFIHFPSLLFHININKIRQLYKSIKEYHFLETLKSYQNVMKETILYNILAIILDIFYILVSFYFSFGFCATYLYQKKSFIGGIIFGIISDITLFELLYEFILSILYKYRKKGRCIIQISEFLNKMRTIRALN